MSDRLSTLDYWQSRMEYVIGLDEGDPDGGSKDRFLQELRAARAALTEDENDRLDLWLAEEYGGYMAAVEVWHNQLVAMLAQKAADALRKEAEG
jgi:hypothetical protein